MRTLTDHKLNGLNEAIDIIVTDQPGPGGANHRYEIIRRFGPTAPDPIKDGEGQAHGHSPLAIEFQNGPVLEAGFNGITNETLLAIVIDRLRGFQYTRDEKGDFSMPFGQYYCAENTRALQHIQEALMWLQKRTRDRLARGVEGTSKV